MFEKKEHIVSSSFGVCMVEKITKLVVGREQQMEYYVLQSVWDRTKKSYIPVEHHETVLRKPMDESQASEILETMVINGSDCEENSFLTLQQARECLESGQPERWQKGAEYYLLHENELEQQIRETLEKVWDHLSGELAFVLKKNRNEIRQIVANRIK